MTPAHLLHGYDFVNGNGNVNMYDVGYFDSVMLSMDFRMAANYSIISFCNFKYNCVNLNIDPTLPLKSLDLLIQSCSKLKVVQFVLFMAFGYV